MEATVTWPLPPHEREPQRRMGEEGKGEGKRKPMGMTVAPPVTRWCAVCGGADGVKAVWGAEGACAELHARKGRWMGDGGGGAWMAGAPACGALAGFVAAALLPASLAALLPPSRSVR